MNDTKIKSARLDRERLGQFNFSQKIFVQINETCVSCFMRNMVSKSNCILSVGENVLGVFLSYTLSVKDDDDV